MKNMKIQRWIDRILSKSTLAQACLWFAVVALVFGVLLLFKWLYRIDVSLENWALHFLNPANYFPETNVDKLWALIIGIFGMFCMSGLLIPIVNNMLTRRVEKVQNGQVYYHFKNHVVIIGYNKLCIGLVKQLMEKYKDADIVIQTIRNVPEIRHELFAHLNHKNENKIIFLDGNRTLEEDLQKLHLTHCNEIFILGETDEEDIDSLNIDCLEKINTIIKDNEKKLFSNIKKTLRCNVLFQYQSTFAIFQQQDVRINSCVDFVPFNCYETWAQKVLVEKKSNNIEYMPLDHEPITADSDKHVHLVVIGMSSMGIAMGIEAAHLCHFPNFLTKRIKTRITFIDEHADREMNFLMGRYKHLFKEIDYFYKDFDNESNNFDNQSSKDKFTDLEFEFIKSRIENTKMQDEITKWSLDSSSYLTIAVCFSFSPEAIAAAMYLPEEVYNKKTPVLVLQELSAHAMSLISKTNNDNDYRKYENVKPFGMLDDCYNLKQTDILPMMINYVYEETKKGLFVNVKPNDNILESMWKKLTTSLKWSNRYCANSIKIKQRSLEIKPDKELSEEENKDQINLLAQIEHNRWNIEKLLMGYRPTTPEEAEEIANGKQTKNYYKDRFIQNDIRQFHTLSIDDDGVVVSQYDVNIAKSLPLLLKELIKSEKSNNQAK